MHDSLPELLRSRGFAWLTDARDDRAFVDLASSLGDVVDDTMVRLVPGKRTYLASPDAIPQHTDHPKADFVAWRCEAQDARDGASLLIDGRTVLEQLTGDTRERLGRIELPAMVRLGDDAQYTPIVRRDRGTERLFYAPWLEPTRCTHDDLAALQSFRAVLARTTPVAVRLRPGQILVVDNRRVLHGRNRLSADSTRRLRRLWIRARPALEVGTAGEDGMR